MTEHLLRARLFNAGGELIAEGPCWLDESTGQATLEPEREPGVIQKERGRLALELDTGRSLLVSDKPMIFRLGPSAGGNGTNGRRSLYRLRLLDDASTTLSTSASTTLSTSAQEADAAGAVGEGAPAAPMRSERLRPGGETPAAR